MAKVRTFYLVLIASGSLACGLLGQWLLLTLVGPGAETDAYFATLVLPQVLLAIAAGPLMNVLVPTLATQDAGAQRMLAWRLLGGFGGGGLLLFLLVAATASLWVPLVFPGFSGERLALAVGLTRIQAAMLGASIVALVLTANAHAMHRFERAESAVLAGSVAALGVMAAALPTFGVMAAAWAGVARAGVQIALVLPLLGRPARPDADTLQVVRGAWSRMRPLILSGAVTKCDPLLDRALLSMAPGGALTLFQLAQTLFSALLDLVHRAWIAPALPGIAKRIATDPAFCHRHLRRMLWRAIWLSLLALLLLASVGESVLHLVFAYGRFSAEEVTRLWWFLLGLAGVPVAAISAQILALGYYAQADTATPARVGLVTFLMFVPVKIIAFMLGGVAALVAACSVYYLSNTLGLFLLQRRRGGQQS